MQDAIRGDILSQIERHYEVTRGCLHRERGPESLDYLFTLQPPVALQNEQLEEVPRLVAVATRAARSHSHHERRGTCRERARSR
jgi:hypothetical protein